MERDLAKHVVIVGFGAMRDLANLLELIKPHCDEAEYAAYARSVAAISGAISQQLIDNAIASHPDLEAEMDAKIKRYGKLI